MMASPTTWQTRAAAICCSLLAFVNARAAADESVAIAVHEATELSASATADGGVVLLGIAGRIWRRESSGLLVPVTGPEVVAAHPRVSPDGLRVLYEDIRPDHTHIAMLDLTDKSVRPLTTGNWEDIDPAWSPSGAQILFASNRTGQFAIWQIDTEQEAVLRLTVRADEQIDPAVDPANSRLAFIVPTGAGAGLYVQRIAGGAVAAGAQRIVHEENLRAPAWRTDGSVISYAAPDPAGYRMKFAILSEPPIVKSFGGRELVSPDPVSWSGRNQFIYAVNGHLQRRAFAAPGFEELPFTANLILPAPTASSGGASSFGDWPAISRSIRGLTGLPTGGLVISALGDLWELGPDGAPVQQLSNDVFDDQDPAASPNGGLLAFVSDRSGVPQIWLRDQTTGLTRRLTDEAHGASHPAWPLSGDRLAYLAGNGPAGAATLKVIGVEGGRPTVLSTTGPVASLHPEKSLVLVPTTAAPAWSADGSQVSVIAMAEPTDPSDAGARLLSFASDGSGHMRRSALFAEAASPGEASIARSPDGRQLVIASPAGVSILPLGYDGVPRAEWRGVTAEPASAVAWSGVASTLWYLAGGELRRLGLADSAATTISLPGDLGADAPAARRVVRAGRLFDPESGNYVTRQDIVIVGNRIAAVHDWDPSERAENLLDASTRTVVPGLVDASLDSELDSPAAEGRRLLAFGVTTVGMVDDEPGRIAGTADSWRVHRAGPRIRALRSRCRNNQDGGASSPWLAAARGQSAGLFLSRASGGNSTPACRLATPLYQDAIDVLVSHKIPLVPALASTYEQSLMESSGGLLEAERYQQQIPPAERMTRESAWRERAAKSGMGPRETFRARSKDIARMAVAGGRVAAASGSALLPAGFGLHAELAALRTAGLTPGQLLRAATLSAAQALGLEKEVGQIAPGMLADMLVVDGDPLRDPRDLLQLQALVLDGQPIQVAELESAVPGTAEKFTAPGTPKSRASAPPGRHPDRKSPRKSPRRLK